MDVYGRYIELLTMVYQPTNNSEGAPPCGIGTQQGFSFTLRLGGKSKELWTVEKKSLPCFMAPEGRFHDFFAETPDMDVSKMKRGTSSWGVSSKFGGDKKTPPSARFFSHKSQLWLGKTPPWAKYSLSQRGYVRSQIPLLFFHTWIWIPNCLQVWL